MAADSGMQGEILRYSRQLILDGFGTEAQERLKSARVLVAGAGGLGSPVLLYLAAAGVGTLGIADFDTVTLSNLNRQIIHHTEDIGRKKVDSAEEKIRRLNPRICVEKHYGRLGLDTVEEMVGSYDMVVDAADNFPARYLISDCCFFLGKPLVEGAASGFEGILFTIVPGRTPCYRCLYPAPPEDGVMPSCSDTGILGAVTGIIGSLQAMEVIKVLTGTGETFSGRLLTVDALTGSFREIRWPRDENCPLCGKNPVIRELIQYEVHCKRKGDHSSV